MLHIAKPWYLEMFFSKRQSGAVHDSSSWKRLHLWRLGTPESAAVWVPSAAPSQPCVGKVCVKLGKGPQSEVHSVSRKRRIPRRGDPPQGSGHGLRTKWVHRIQLSTCAQLFDSRTHLHHHDVCPPQLFSWTPSSETSSSHDVCTCVFLFQQ